MDLPEPIASSLPALAGLFQRIVARNDLIFPLEVIAISPTNGALVGLRYESDGNSEITCRSKEQPLLFPLEVNFFDVEGKSARMVMSTHECTGCNTGLFAEEQTA